MSIICPYCLSELHERAAACPQCGGVFAGRNPAGSLPVGTVLGGRYTVGEIERIDGEGILYRGAENVGRFRVTIKEYMPLTLAAERGMDATLRPKLGSEVLFKTTRMDFADLYRSIQRITPANGLEAVLDVFEENNTVYAVMENPGGVPLGRWLDQHPGPLPSVGAGLRHAAAGVRRRGRHAPSRPCAPGHLPGEHSGAGKWPRPADRLRDGGAAHGGQRLARAAVRGLLGSGAVFHRRV